jgi:prepilin-type N-terminal cleavage/methylation domain-containing protein
MRRRGYTLTELLVVVTIIIILVAATLPIAKQVMLSSQTREASRTFSGYLAMARSNASRHNRPCGLWLELEQPIGAPNTIRQCTQMFLAEVPPAYAGATTSARGIIRVEPGQTVAEFVPLTGTDGNPTLMIPPDGRIDEDTAEKAILLSLIEEGDTCLVKFDYKGDWFRLLRGKASFSAPYNDPSRLYYFFSQPPVPAPPYTPLQLVLGSMSQQMLPPSFNNPLSVGFRFQFLRMPRKVGGPLEMTAGTCIDMAYSGIGRDGSEFGQLANKLVVMFSPGGGIDGFVSDNNSTFTQPGGTLHFLIGKVEKMNPPIAANADHPTNMFMFDRNRSNLSDVNSIWVSIGRLNGSVTSTDNTPPPVDEATLSPTNVVIFPNDPVAAPTRRQVLNPSAPAPQGPADQNRYLEWCREVATGREQMGGK